MKYINMNNVNMEYILKEYLSTADIAIVILNNLPLIHREYSYHSVHPDM